MWVLFLLNYVLAPRFLPPYLSVTWPCQKKKLKIPHCSKGKKYIFTSNCTCQKYKAAFLISCLPNTVSDSSWKTESGKKNEGRKMVVGKECSYLFLNNEAEYKQDKKFLKRLLWWCLLWIVPSLNKRKASHWKKKHFYHSKRSQGSPFKIRYFLNKASECSPAGNEHLIS